MTGRLTLNNTLQSADRLSIFQIDITPISDSPHGCLRAAFSIAQKEPKAMNLQDPADYARRTAAAKKPVDIAKPAIATPDVAEPDAAEADPKEMMTIKIGKKPEGGYSRSIDTGDGLPPDDTDHETLSDAAKLDEQLEAKFGESAVDDAEEEIAPGIHEKVAAKLEGGDKADKPVLAKGGFLGKFGGGE